MSADYDRLFHSSEAAQPEEETVTVDRDSAASVSPAPMPVTTGRGDAPPGLMPVPPPATQTASAPTTAPPPRAHEITSQLRPTHAMGQQHVQNGMMRSPQAPTSTGARYEQPRQAPPQQARPAPAPAPSQHFLEAQPDTRAVWGTAMQHQTSGPVPTSAASIGNHRAIDALSHVGVRSAVKMPPQRGWRRLIYMLTRINLGLSPDELYELDLHARIRRNARDSYQIGVFGLKGGVGKTAITVGLGSTLSKIRGDRILAVDADPDGGNLADRAGRQSAATVADLLSDKDLNRYNDIRAYTSMNGSNLEVLSSEEYSGARREFNDDDWKGTVDVVSRYYNLVLADCGAGLFQPASRGVLSTVAGLVIVASASIDGARQAAVTMDWLRQNGYQDLLGRSCVVINHVTPSKPNIDVEDLVQQFERHVAPGRVVVLPYDKHIAAGTEIQLDLLSDTFRRRITELAAALSDDFDRLERR
jgi:MinD-like ATPase involved in chromosome partitioning or flagellar assembly